MRSYDQIEEVFLHTKRPYFYNFSLAQDGLCLQMDVSRENLIQEMYFYAPEAPPSPHWVLASVAMVDYCLGKKIEDVLPAISWETVYQFVEEEGADSCLKLNEFMDSYDNGKLPLINLPVYLIQQLGEKILNVPGSVSRLMGQSSDQLVCRCFGVFKDQLEWAIKQDKSVRSLEEVTAATMAGAGCGRCLEDLAKMMRQIRPEDESLFETGSRSRPEGMTPARFLLTLEKLRKEFVQEENISSRFFPYSVKKSTVFFEREDQGEKAENDLLLFQRYVNEKLRTNLLFCFF